MDSTTTWRELISDALEAHKERWEDVEANTLTEAELDVKFDSGYGGEEGIPFTLWTANRVYFPICYDGAEWVGSAPRNPSPEKCERQGG